MVFHFDVIIDGEYAKDNYGLALQCPEEAYEEAVAVASALQRERDPEAPVGSIVVGVRTSDDVPICRVTLGFDLGIPVSQADGRGDA